VVQILQNEVTSKSLCIRQLALDVTAHPLRLVSLGNIMATSGVFGVGGAD